MSEHKEAKNQICLFVDNGTIWEARMLKDIRRGLKIPATHIFWK